MKSLLFRKEDIFQIFYSSFKTCLQFHPSFLPTGKQYFPDSGNTYFIPFISIKLRFLQCYGWLHHIWYILSFQRYLETNSSKKSYLLWKGSDTTDYKVRNNMTLADVVNLSIRWVPEKSTSRYTAAPFIAIRLSENHLLYFINSILKNNINPGRRRKRLRSGTYFMAILTFKRNACNHGNVHDDLRATHFD